MREHEQDELAHYSTATADVEYEYPFGWGELEGIACRTDFDLKRHSEASGTDLVYFDPQTKEHYTPYVIEPAGGINRMALTFLIDAYEEEQLEKDTRAVLRFHPEIAPITCAVFPLVKKDGMPEKAREVEASCARGAHDEHLLRREGRHRPSLSPPGRDRHALLRDRRRGHRGGRRGHRSRARLDDPGEGQGR